MTYVLISKDLHEIQEMEISIPTSDNTQDNDNEAECLDWRHFNQVYIHFSVKKNE